MITATPKQVFFTTITGFALWTVFSFYTLSTAFAQAPPPPPPPPPGISSSSSGGSTSSTSGGGSTSSTSGGGSTSSGGAAAASTNSSGGAAAQQSGGGACTSAPIILSPGTQYIPAGQTFSYTMQTSGDAVDKYFFVGLPAGITQTGNSINGAATTPGTYRVGMTASNACGIDSDFFDLVVTGVAAASVSLTEIPETGSLFSHGAMTMSLYFFVILMASGALLAFLWPSLSPQKVSATNRRRNRRF